MSPRLVVLAVALLALAACGAAPSQQHPTTQQSTPTRVEATPTTGPMKGLMAMAVPSLDPDVRIFIGGGDGATLLPFHTVAVSVKGKDWQTFVMPKIHGARGYTEGSAVLPDGRLLVLLNSWSSDRGWRHLGPQHHGLWISQDGSWARYAPYAATFQPALVAPDRIDGLVVRGRTLVALASSGRYVSTDDGRTFRRR
ncbi:hypothetical protein [Nocardioides montaniterrae]